MGRLKYKFNSAVHFFVNVILDFVYPPFCVFCNKSLQENEKTVCVDCWHKQKSLAKHYLPAVNMPYIPGPKVYLDGSLACYEYSEMTQELIHLFKYRKLDDLASAFGRDLAKALVEFENYMDVDAIVPVPLHFQRLKERGFNQSHLLAEAIATETGLELIENVLIRNRYTNPQAKMKRIERIKNVLDAFELSSKTLLVGKNIVLIDDVMTTGSTMNECARVLKQGGTKSVVSLTLSRI